MNDVLPIVSVTPDQIACFSAAIARIARNEDHRYKIGSDDAINDFEEVLGADINVYDRNGQRYVVFFFQHVTIEVNVGKQPPKPNAPEIPEHDPDPGTPGTPVLPQLAKAA